MIEESFTSALRMGNGEYISPISDTQKFPFRVQNKEIESGLEYQAQLSNQEQDPEVKKELSYSLSQMSHGKAIHNRLHKGFNRKMMLFW